MLDVQDLGLGMKEDKKNMQTRMDKIISLQ